MDICISCRSVLIDTDQGNSPRIPDTEPCRQVQSLEMPTIDLMLVTLMGMSQSGYIGGKIAARSPTIITNLKDGLKGIKFLVVVGFYDNK